ncbi:hypothetical protein LCGC14_1824930 [marine sediment metagenome]|uniref:Uncharacterized protein n=1 Tax=marine sediment metagenome TaxID=412755 RepID=A0A0F9H613_9ZZZZ
MVKIKSFSIILKINIKNVTKDVDDYLSEYSGDIFLETSTGEKKIGQIRNQVADNVKDLMKIIKFKITMYDIKKNSIKIGTWTN